MCRISGSNSQKRRGHWRLKEFGVLCLNQRVTITRAYARYIDWWLAASYCPQSLNIAPTHVYIHYCHTTHVSGRYSTVTAVFRPSNNIITPHQDKLLLAHCQNPLPLGHERAQRVYSSVYSYMQLEQNTKTLKSTKNGIAKNRWWGLRKGCIPQSLKKRWGWGWAVARRGRQARKRESRLVDLSLTNQNNTYVGQIDQIDHDLSSRSWPAVVARCCAGSVQYRSNPGNIF